MDKVRYIESYSKLGRCHSLIGYSSLDSNSNLEIIRN